MDEDKWLIKLTTGEWDVISQGYLKWAMDDGVVIPLLISNKNIELKDIQWATPLNNLDKCISKPRGMSKSHILAWARSRRG